MSHPTPSLILSRGSSSRHLSPPVVSIASIISRYLSSASSSPLATRLSDLDRCACTPYTRTEHLDRFTHANFSLRPLVCHVAMAAQAMSMVPRFDSSFLCRLGASVELLHHLARPSREDAMHRAHSDVCTRHRMPCCTCCSQQIWIDLSLHQVVEARLPAAQASWYDPGEDRTGPNRARYSFKLGAKGHLAHTTL